MEIKVTTAAEARLTLRLTLTVTRDSRTRGRLFRETKARLNPPAMDA